MTLNFSIRHMALEDVSEVTKVHTEAFSGFFLSFLGERFLAELYSAIIEDSTGIKFVAESEKRVCGFVAGAIQPQGFYKRLFIQKWWRFGWASLPAVIQKPTIVPRLLRAFTLQNEYADDENTGLLMSVAVSPAFQGYALGGALVNAFLRESSEKRLSKVKLTTDKYNNEVANRFYQKLGFKVLRSYTTPEGRHMNEYIISLPAPKDRIGKFNRQPIEHS